MLNNQFYIRSTSFQQLRHELRPISGHILKLFDTLPRIDVNVPPVGCTPAQYQSPGIVRVKMQLQHCAQLEFETHFTF